MILSLTGKSMNNRVLELIKNPKIITEADLNILELESEKMPYAQSIRALYLYGINLYKAENYKEHLSTTAAYTTDKKILYQFINSQKSNQKKEILVQKISDETSQNQSPKQVISDNTILDNLLEIEDTSLVVNKFDIEKIIESENQENSDFVLIDGEKNRLLYEGEENFLEEKSQEIDFEATKESGVITVKDDLEIKENLIVNDENRSEKTISEHINVEEILEIPKEEILEAKDETRVQDEDSSGNISFNGIEDFLPQVKFSVPKNHLDYLNPPKKQTKKADISVDEKLVSKTQYKEPLFTETSEEKIDENQISFENTQTFNVSEPVDNPPVNETVDKKTKTNFQISEIETPVTEKSEETEELVSEWKPMTFSVNMPDALIGKTAETEKPKQEIVVEEKIIKPEVIQDLMAVTEQILEEEEEEETQITETERPVLNVSFFGEEVSKIEERKITTEPSTETQHKETPESNVGTFINTWQSWLKIDRPQESESTEKTIIVKEKIIDQFIEKNPKISQLKDEVNFVIKEKKDDISHLMTETLAKLYAEQKLYSKAIKAYEILSEKHPHKQEYFQEKIEEVKEIRKS